MSPRDPLATILVPTDFSESADHALARACRLPLAPVARLHLLHVVTPDVPDAVRAPVIDHAQGALAERVVRVRAQNPTIEVTSDLVVGEPFVEIIRRSRQLGAELVVLGRYGRAPLDDVKVIGTTTQRVVRKGDVPVLAVNLPPGDPYQRPLVASDLSDASRRVIDAVLRVVPADLATIHVVHALHVPFEGFITPTAAGRERSGFRRTFEERTAAQLETLFASFEGHGLQWEKVVRHGEARRVVVEEAVRCGADLIGLGTHGRSGISHLLLGSVAEWVLGRAPCDVLVAHPVRFSFALP
jgi:nucleotide-binding universal stress UspA family protein